MKILDPDSLVRASTKDKVGDDWNIWIDTWTKLITLWTYWDLDNTAPQSTSWVTLQAVYSYLKEEWKTDNALIKFDFPMLSITNEQFELINGWNFEDDTTKNYIRDWGWALNSWWTNVEEYMNITTLWAFNDSTTDQAYYLQSDWWTPTDVVLTWEVNQGIKIYWDSDHWDIDYRSFFKTYLREQGKIYGFGDLITDQNMSTLTYKKYALPLSNGIDLKVTHDDATVDDYWVSIEYFTDDQTRTIWWTDYSFKVIIDGNNKTAEEIYEAVESLLRKSDDIDSWDGNVRWDTAEWLLRFVWDTLKTKLTSVWWVYIDNFIAADTNRLVFVDNEWEERTYPYVAAGNISFNENLINSSDAVYRMFFTNDDAWDDTGRDFWTADAIIVADKDGNDIAGDVNWVDMISFYYDYDWNSQRGDASKWKDAPITIVAVWTDNSQYVKTTWTILRTTANNFALVSSLERNYSNPA